MGCHHLVLLHHLHPRRRPSTCNQFLPVTSRNNSCGLSYSCCVCNIVDLLDIACLRRTWLMTCSVCKVAVNINLIDVARNRPAKPRPIRSMCDTLLPSHRSLYPHRWSTSRIRQTSRPVPPPDELDETAGQCFNILIQVYSLHFVETRRFSLNRKYITYPVALRRWPRTTATGNVHKNIWWNLDMRFLRYGSGQADRQTDKQTRWSQYFSPLAAT